MLLVLCIISSSVESSAKRFLKTTLIGSILLSALVELFQKPWPAVMPGCYWPRPYAFKDRSCTPRHGHAIRRVRLFCVGVIDQSRPFMILMLLRMRWKKNLFRKWGPVLHGLLSASIRNYSDSFIFHWKAFLLCLSRHNGRDYAPPIFAVQIKIAVQSKYAALRVQFAHPDQTCIGQRHGDRTIFQ